MPRRDVTVPAFALLKNNIFHLPVLKIDGLKFALDNFDITYKNTFNTKLPKEEKESFKEAIKLEIVVTTVHFAEILGSYLLAFSKGRKALQRALFSYKVGDVNNFYDTIALRKNPYIAKLFSYPQQHQIQSPEMRQKFKESCERIKNDLVEIGKFYKDNHDLYNSYKHGLRMSCLSVGDEDPTKRYPVISYLIPDKAFYQAKTCITRIDYKQAENVTLKITALLSNSANFYLERIVERKNEVIGRLY
jgi:hypothetical protein